MAIIPKTSLLTAGEAQNKHRPICEEAGISIAGSCSVQHRRRTIKNLGFSETKSGRGLAGMSHLPPADVPQTRAKRSHGLLA